MGPKRRKPRHLVASGSRSAPTPIGRHQAGIGPKSLAGIARRHFQGAQHGYGSQRKALFHHGGIDIPPTGDAAAKATTKRIMAFNAAGHVLAMQQSRKPCCRRRAAIAPRGITATSLSARGRRYTGKPDDAIPKT